MRKCKISRMIWLPILILVTSINLQAQDCAPWITGETTISCDMMGQNVTYSSPASFGNPTYHWTIQGAGQVITESANTVTVQWIGSGTHRLLLERNFGFGSSYNCLDVTVSAPTVPVMVNGQGTCDPNQAITLAVSNPISGITYKWYTNSSGGSAFHTGTSYSSVFTSSTTFFVSATEGTCESERIPVTATAQTFPFPPLENNSQVVACSGQTSVTLTATSLTIPSSTNTTHWYLTPNYLNEVPVHTGTSYQAPVQNATYYVANANSNYTCESERIPIQVIVPNLNVSLVPNNAIGNNIIDETTASVQAVTEVSAGNTPLHYWAWPGTSPAATAEMLSSVPQQIANGQSILLYAYEGGCWSTPVTYTAQGDLDADLNWTLQKVYDDQGNVIAATKTFFDANANVLQTQSRLITEGRIMASQPVYDQYHRAVISTMPAPISGNSFKYNEQFITVNGGESYTSDKFHLPIDHSSEGSLGHYYGALSEEPLNAQSGYPYNRVEYYDDGRSEAKRAAQAGDAFRIGATGNHQNYSYNFPLLQEMDHYLNTKYTHVLPNTPNTITTLVGNGHKTVSRDVDGKEVVTFFDVEGNTLATALTGDTQHQHTVNLQKQVALGRLYWANFEHDTDELTIQLNIKGTDHVQIYRSFDDNTYELVYDGTTTIVGQESKVGITIPVRTANEPTAMFFQVRSLQEFSLEKKVPQLIQHVNFVNTMSSKEWEIIKDIQGLEGQNLYEFHIPINQVNVALSFPQNHSVHVNLIKLDDNEVEKVIYTNPTVTTNNPLPLLAKGFYRIQVDTDESTWSFQKDYAQMAALVSYDYTIGNLSYIFYDDAGMNIASISPNGVDALFNGGLYSNLDKTTSNYNTVGNVTASTSIDTQLGEVLYRKDGSVRFSQDAQQKQEGKFSYVMYDELAQPYESGEYHGNDISFENYTGAGGGSSTLHYLENTEETSTHIGGLTKSNCADIARTVFDLPVQGSGRIQENLDGAVSFTEYSPTRNNATHQTWYSYDEFGQLTWLIQQVEDLGLKTIDYEYDYLGNVMQVIYQKDDPSEAFYHQYEYDIDQRLTKVQTSRNGVDWEQQAHYIYYLDGRLKRVEIADELQGMDYVYTINGWLKSINNVDLGKDQDGYVNNFGHDVFNLQLEYFTGDYLSAQSNDPIRDVNFGNHATQHNGNITTALWSTQKPGEISNNTFDPLSYSYQYDHKNQLLKASFGKLTVAGSIQEATDKQYGVENITYDLNGNLQTLRRYDDGGTTNIKDDFTYSYHGNTNQLQTVSAYGNYSYNAVGQLITEYNFRKGKGMAIQYNSDANVTEVKDDQDNLIAKYQYDDRGFRVKKTTYSTQGASFSTWYVRDISGNILSIYEKENTAAITQSELPIYGASKLGDLKLLNGEWSTLYEAKDHLGNVRAIFREGVNKTTSYYTSIENGTTIDGVPAQASDIQFEYDGNYNDIIRTDHAHTGNMSIALDGDFSELTYGPHIWIPIKQHDNVYAEVFYRVEAAPGIGGRIGEVATTDPLINSSTTKAPLSGEGGQQGSTITGGVTLLSLPKLLSKSTDNRVTGREYYTAFLRLELYAQKDDPNPIETREVRLSIAGNGELSQWLSVDINWTQIGFDTDLCDGFVKAYVVNQGNKQIWFDDFTVEHVHNAAKVEVLSYKDYYPFGAVMKESCEEISRYGYQGDFAEHDEETGWNHFELRKYDPVIGRFTTIDPYNQFHSPYMGMGNNPVNGIDPDGGLVGALIGGIIGGLTGDGPGFDWERAKSGFVAGLAADVVVLTAAATGGLSLGALAVGGALGGGVGYVAENALNGKQSNVGDLIFSMVAGAVSGGVFRKAGPSIRKLFTKAKPTAIGSINMKLDGVYHNLDNTVHSVKNAKMVLKAMRSGLNALNKTLRNSTGDNNDLSILLLGRINSLLKSINNGTVYKEDILVETNRIRVATISLIEELIEGGLKL